MEKIHLLQIQEVYRMLEVRILVIYGTGQSVVNTGSITLGDTSNVYL